MSASAVKSSLQGAPMQASASAAHSIIPINMMAQKVVPSTTASPETSPVKPLPGTTLSYTTLQPPPSSQPLSLVQEHKPPPPPPPPPQQSAPAGRLSGEKEPEVEKNIPNGTEIQKPVVIELTETESPKKQIEANQQNNNLNTENLTESKPEPSPDPVPETPAVTSVEVQGMIIQIRAIAYVCCSV